MVHSSDVLRAALAERVPEVANGLVEIVSAAREPGRWAKVAVDTRLRTLNPASVCIGWSGLRVADVQTRMGGERISIIRFDPDPARYVLNALQITTARAEITDSTRRQIRVIVDPADYSRTLGRAGHNVRLSRRLTGWHIQVCTASCRGDRHRHPADLSRSIQSGPVPNPS